MTFAAASWLWLLAPWAGLAVWLLARRGESVTVPFVELWRGSASRRRSAWSFSAPPIALIAMLLCMLLGILAGARPVIRRDVPLPRAIVVLDRGATMSA